MLKATHLKPTVCRGKWLRACFLFFFNQRSLQPTVPLDMDFIQLHNPAGWYIVSLLYYTFIT